MPHVLIIDDDNFIRDSLSIFFGHSGYDVKTASTAQEGLGLLGEIPFDICFVDMLIGDESGLYVLKNIPPANENTPFIVMTAYATVKNAVEAIKLGAFDYISKPFSLEEILLTAQRALEFSYVRTENIQLRKTLKRTYDFRTIIGKSEAIKNVFGFIEKISEADSTVLITGESGTGKELIAKTIHYHSPRAHNPFIPINCTAIPSELLESELFGHVRGAFTGAVSTRVGRFELASGGTLFLDEIGELDQSLQVKLLRVLQEKEFERVGSTKTIKMDVRIIAATNRNLEKATKEGLFREDLYYRLNVIPVHLPPLREMKDDIPLLIEHFVNLFSSKKKKPPVKFSDEAMRLVMEYPWPGNVRELENLIERLGILHDNALIRPEHLPEAFRNYRQPEPPVPKEETMPAEKGINLNEAVQNLEQRLITQALEKSGGVKSKAARLLGLKRTTLIEKMKKMGIAELKQGVEIGQN